MESWEATQQNAVIYQKIIWTATEKSIWEGKVQLQILQVKVRNKREAKQALTYKAQRTQVSLWSLWMPCLQI